MITALTTTQNTHCTSHHHTQCYYYIAALGELNVFCAQNGWAALHMAALEGKVDVVRLLTEARAQVNIQTKVNVHIMDVLFTSKGSNYIISKVIIQDVTTIIIIILLIM